MSARQLGWMRPAAIATPLVWACLACGPRDNAQGGDSMAAGGTDSASGMVMNDSSTMSTGTPNNAGMTDPSMAQLLAVVNRGEVSAGTMASTKARNADVKAFARDMVAEHRKAERMLDSIASKSGWMVDSASMASGMASGANTTGAAGASTSASGGTMSATNPAGDSRLNTMIQQMQQMQQTSMEQLRGATGAAFDRSYMDSQLAGHQQVLDLLNQYMNNVQNNELRTYVTNVKNSVEQHRARAEQIKSKLGS